MWPLIDNILKIGRKTRDRKPGRSAGKTGDSLLGSDYDSAVPIDSILEQMTYVCKHLCSCGALYDWQIESESVFPDSTGNKIIKESVRCPACSIKRDFVFRLVPKDKPDFALLALGRSRQPGMREYAMALADEQTRSELVKNDSTFSFNLDSLRKKLRTEHIRGVHYYRGQIRRQEAYDNTRWAVESLLPADLRFVFGKRPATSSEITAARKRGRDKRDRFADFLLKHPITKESQRFLGELQKQQKAYLAQVFLLSPSLQSLFVKSKGDSSTFSPSDQAAFVEALTKVSSVPGSAQIEQKFWKQIWSLAQHYLIETALLDITADLNVAIWFATHDWRSGAVVDRVTTPVIYRFNKNLLLEKFATYNESERERALRERIVRPAPCFFISLDEIPLKFARRPKRQAGASICGFDQMPLVNSLIESKAVEIFEFLHDGLEPNVARLSAGYLAPTDDPFLELVEEFRNLEDRSNLKGK